MRQRLRSALAAFGDAPVSLTTRGRVFLVAAPVLFVLAHLLSIPALALAACLLLGLVVLAALYVVVGQSRIAIDRSFTPDVVEPDESARVTVVVSNLSPFPSLESTWVDRLAPALVGEARGRLPALGASRSRTSRVRFRYSLRGRHRGRHAVGPLEVKVLDPFGLVHRRHRLGTTRDLVVLPHRVRLERLGIGSGDDGATRPSPHQLGVGEDDVIARPYQPGDAMKRLHWKATAHRGELMVRQEEHQTHPQAAVLLDVDAASHDTSRDRRGRWEHSARFEWCVVMTASLVEHLAARGFVVTVDAPGGGVHRDVREGADHVRDVLVDLAVVEPADVPVADLEHRSSGDQIGVLVAGRVDVQRAEAWSVVHAATSLAVVDERSAPDAVELLRARGWHVATYRESESPVDVWGRLQRGTVEHASA